MDGSVCFSIPMVRACQISSHVHAMFPVPPMDLEAACKSCSPPSHAFPHDRAAAKVTSGRGKGSAPLRDRIDRWVSHLGGLGRCAADARPSLDSASKSKRRTYCTFS